jgi:two-component system OmpR family response regulator
MSEKPNLLIVDDSQELSDVISEYLENHGFRIDTTTKSLDAIKLLENNLYDAVVSDIHMPEMDGLELMAAIKSKYKGLPVVLITGYSVSEARRIALEKGADAFVAKPFHMKELLEVIWPLINNNKINNNS